MKLEVKEIHNGDIVTEGPFSDIGFTNIIETLLLEKILEADDTKKDTFDTESITSSKNETLFLIRTWYIKPGIAVEYYLNNYEPYLGGSLKPHISVYIHGLEYSIKEVEKKINQAIQEGKYNID